MSAFAALANQGHQFPDHFAAGAGRRIACYNCGLVVTLLVLNGQLFVGYKVPSTCKGKENVNV